MSKSKQKQLEERVKGFFAKNKDVNKLYVTSDGNMFRAKHYADDWSYGLKDREVVTVYRYAENKEKASEAKVLEDHGGDAGDTSDTIDTGSEETESANEKGALIKEHIELFDKKPAPNIGLESLKTKIAERKAELEAENNVGTEGESKSDSEVRETGAKEGDQVESASTEK